MIRWLKNLNLLKIKRENNNNTKNEINIIILKTR